MGKSRKKEESLLVSENGKFMIRTSINGKEQILQVKAGEFLLDVLRREGYHGVKKGCDTGDCGSCTVIIEGQAVLSCLMLAVQAHNRSITTIEGMGTPLHPHPIQKAFVAAGAVQCGYCIPGMILVAKELLEKNPYPDENAIRHALDGNLCRCTGYVKQIEAVKLASEMMKNSLQDKV